MQTSVISVIIVIESLIQGVSITQTSEYFIIPSNKGRLFVAAMTGKIISVSLQKTHGQRDSDDHDTSSYMS